MSKNFKMANFLGPFVAIVISIICILAGVLGVFVFFTSSPQWAWLIVVAALVSGYFVDRLLYWGMSKMSKEERALSDQLVNHMKTIRKNVAELEKNKPPTIPNTKEPLN